MLTHVNAAIRHQQLLTQIRYDADHDRLTGLPNRQRLAAEIDELLAADPVGARAGLILAALGNYTEVTDTLGHAASDELLLVTAGLLREHAPAAGARRPHGGRAVRRPAARPVAGRHRAGRPPAARGRRPPAPASPASTSRSRSPSASPPRRCTAPTPARSCSAPTSPCSPPPTPAGVASYHPVLDQQSLRRLQLGTELEQAMADGQISVVFQPIIDAQTSDIVSVETLVRWAHPRYGSIPPDDFIHLAEQIGRIGAVTDHVLDLALARCRRWLDQDIALSVAVNLSVHCLTEPDLVTRVRRALQRHGVPGELLTLELTEGSVVDDSVRDSTRAGRPARAGPAAVDGRLRHRLLVAVLAAPAADRRGQDRQVLRAGHGDRAGRACIVRAVIELAHNLGLRVVAEGVEDELTRDLLAEMGCDKLQGFLFSRPLPDDRLEAWLLARTGVRSAAPGATHRRLFVRA